MTLILAGIFHNIILLFGDKYAMEITCSALALAGSWSDVLDAAVPLNHCFPITFLASFRSFNCGNVTWTDGIGRAC